MKLTDAQAIEAHKRYLADRRHTLATLAPDLEISPSALRKRWLRIGLPLSPASDRGRNLAAQERAAKAAAEAEAQSAPFHARRSAAKCTTLGLRIDVARRAWKKYKEGGHTIAGLAAEIKCAYTTLQRAFARLKLGAKAARKAMDLKRIEPVTLRLHALVAEGMDIDKAAPLVGLTPASAYKRLQKLKAKKLKWKKPEPTGATP